MKPGWTVEEQRWVACDWSWKSTEKQSVVHIIRSTKREGERERERNGEKREKKRDRAKST